MYDFIQGSLNEESHRNYHGKWRSIHISCTTSDLMKNHDKAFGQMKNYYNDITNDNLKLIKDLKDEVRMPP